MTVSYTLDVSTSSAVSFAKVILRWRASLWKSVYMELLLWIFLYFALSGVYRFALDDWQKTAFEDVVSFTYKYTDFIPLTFMLGFFVSIVVNRWWDMFLNIGWIDNPALYISAYIDGMDEKGRMIRRNIVRYMLLVQALIFRDISVTIRRRFPTLDALETAGFMSAAEKKTLLDVDSPNAKYWVPIQWAYFLIQDARKEGRIRTEHGVKELFSSLREFRSSLGKLSCYDSVPVPLVYTQVVYLTVRCYFLICLMGRQYIHPDRDLEKNSTVDYYIPIMTIIQFVFYVGWMKVAEALLNPFGEDDDDFEVNWLLDRNLQVGLTIVDDSVTKRPPLEKDVFWAEKNPEPLYSADAANTIISPLVGSATELPPPKTGEDVIMVPRLQEESIQTDGDLENNGIVRGYSRQTSMSESSSTRAIKGIIRGKLKRLGNTISAQLQRKTSTSVPNTPSLLPKTVENGDVTTKSDNLSGASSITSIIYELAKQMSIEPVSVEEEVPTSSVDRGTMTEVSGIVNQGSAAASGLTRQRVSPDGEPQVRTNDIELPAVMEEDEAHSN